MGREGYPNRHSGVKAGALAGFLLAMLGGDAAAAPVGTFVDCRQNPGGSASVVVNPFRETVTSVGDGVAGTDGKLKRWREQIEVIGLGGSNGEFAVVADGFGPILTFDQVASGEGFLEMNNSESGSRVVVSLPDLGAPLTRALVQVSYHCGGK